MRTPTRRLQRALLCAGVTGILLAAVACATARMAMPEAGVSKLAAADATQLAVHRWPVVPKPPQTAPSTAKSRFASSMTMIAFFPPISVAIIR